MIVSKNKLIKVWDDDNLIQKNIDFLRISTKVVRLPISNYTKEIIQNLLDTYKSMPCAGIAANQLGYDEKIFVGMQHDRDWNISKDPLQNIDDVVPHEDNYDIYINPQIDRVNKNSLQKGEEGCLSIPDISLDITRYDKIKVRYYDMEGRAIKKTLKGFISRLFQHELDHLNGNLMFEDPISKIGIRDSSPDHLKKKFIKLYTYIESIK